MGFLFCPMYIKQNRPSWTIKLYDHYFSLNVLAMVKCECKFTETYVSVINSQESITSLLLKQSYKNYYCNSVILYLLDSSTKSLFKWNKSKTAANIPKSWYFVFSLLIIYFYRTRIICSFYFYSRSNKNRNFDRNFKPILNQ